MSKRDAKLQTRKRGEKSRADLAAITRQNLRRISDSGTPMDHNARIMADGPERFSRNRITSRATEEKNK